MTTVVPLDQEEQKLNQLQNNDYDEYKRPPDLDIAKKHGLATKFAIADPTIDVDESNSCPCCGLPTVLIELPLTASIKEFSFNGPGVPLYFDFLMFSTILIAIYIIIGGIYNIIVSIYGDQCARLNQLGYECNENFYNRYSKANVIFSTVDYAGSALNFLITLIIIVGLFFYRKHLNQLSNEIDEKSILASDYSIIAENIPRDAKEAEIREFFSSIGDKQLEIKKICIGFRIHQYISLEKEKQLKEQTLTKVLEYEKSGKRMPINLPKKPDLILSIQKISQTLDQFEDNLNTFDFSGVAIISFNKEEEANAVCKFFKATRLEIILKSFGRLFGRKDQKLFRNNLIVVSKAPEPGDILWGNLGITVFEHYKRILITNLTTIFLLGICFGIIFGLSYGQFAISNSSSQTTTTAEALIITILGVVASVLISIINNVLALIIRKFAELEQHSTRTEYDISVAKKLGIAQFLNTAIITLIVNLVIKVEGEPVLVSIIKTGGLNTDVTLIFISNSILPWIWLIFDPMYFYKVYLRYKIKSQQENCLITQREANIAFAGPELDLSKKYAQLVKTLMFTYFYAYLLPLGTVLSFGSLIMVYWIEKVLLLRRDSKPLPTGSAMAEDMIDFYGEFILLVYAIGCCVWESLLYNQTFGLTWAQLALAVLNFLFPLDLIFDYFFKVEDQCTPETYDSQYLNFWDDYDRRNPVTQEKAVEIWMKLQQSTQTINGNQKKNVMAKFENQVLTKKKKEKNRKDKQKKVLNVQQIED